MLTRSSLAIRILKNLVTFSTLSVPFHPVQGFFQRKNLLRSRAVVRQRDNLTTACRITPVSLAISTRWPGSESVSLALHDDESRSFRPPTECKKMLRARIGMSIKQTAKGSTIEILGARGWHAFLEAISFKYSAKSRGECDSLRAERTADDLPSLTHYCGEVLGAFETFRVKFVDILGPRRTGGEPTTYRNDFPATN
jgi:hypothetical protein